MNNETVYLAEEISKEVFEDAAWNLWSVYYYAKRKICLRALSLPHKSYRGAQRKK
jgi:hypothetical protein